MINNGNNYQSWNIEIELHFQGDGLVKFIKKYMDKQVEFNIAHVKAKFHHSDWHIKSRHLRYL